MVNTCALLAMVAAAALLVWSGLCAWRGPLGPDLNLVKQWNLAEFVATMRTGIDPDGQEVSKQMPWRPLGRMDDEELAAVYEYLTHLPGF
ncbi:MAG: hypothetical protein QOD29_1347 [Alphaproteobacteria bacterium]|jgi:hypothetical protein|nr:hypothetical protein [Alphaproteobacteria bacterium]